ncbi:acyl-CoA thioesterase [Brevibacterium atlanticum]|uniref:acyl-CoA thioesterase n=1 Tax=Brevibacterium atlanticum TaxID=2697563 RepID=UPI001423FCCA|nr:acyl-CoA thioesterase domain-containing protein [Brevibacterium atlanticum]
MSTDITSPRTSSTFVEAISLTPVESGSDVDSFTAVPQYAPWPKAYGGDMVAQATAAMIATAGQDRVLHSTHSTFMRPVTMFEPVRYDVERIRDGRNYSTRHVRGVQGGKTVFLSTGSFQVPQKGPDYQRGGTEELRVDPESLASAETALSGVSTPAAEYWATGRSFDMRHIPGPVYLSGDNAGHGSAGAETLTVTQAIWLKSFTPLAVQSTDSETANLHRIALSYVCDYTILEPLLRTQGLSWSSDGLVTASLDHAMWFHRTANVDDWILYAQEAESLQSSRGLALGRFFDRSGRLLATVAQEGMIAH